MRSATQPAVASHGAMWSPSEINLQCISSKIIYRRYSSNQLNVLPKSEKCASVKFTPFQWLLHYALKRVCKWYYRNNWARNACLPNYDWFIELNREFSWHFDLIRDCFYFILFISKTFTILKRLKCIRSLCDLISHRSLTHSINIFWLFLSCYAVAAIDKLP